MASIPAKSAARDQGAGESPRPDSRVPTAHLTGRIADGDENAFAMFYEAWFDRVFAMARAMSRRDEAFCLDVVQDCMMRVVRGMKPLTDERAVSAWMGKTVFSTIADRIRVERRRAGREQAAARLRGVAGLEAGVQRASAQPGVQKTRVEGIACTGRIDRIDGLSRCCDAHQIRAFGKRPFWSALGHRQRGSLARHAERCQPLSLRRIRKKDID